MLKWEFLLLPVPGHESSVIHGVGLLLSPCVAWLAALLVVGQELVKAASSNYPVPIKAPTLCSVPNFRHYRVTFSQARGFQSTDDRHCGLQSGKPDGCLCTDPAQCLAGYCIPDDTGVGFCRFPVVQISEIEFWRAGHRVNTRKVPDKSHDAFRVMNAAAVPQTWGVWELEFYHDTLCTSRVVGGVAIASSERQNGFGHSVDHTAPLGAHGTTSDIWQNSHEFIETFDEHGPVKFAFDGRLDTGWWAGCQNPCPARTEWLGLLFSAPVTLGLKCIRIIQDKDRDYASFSLAIQGRRDGATWDTFAVFNAATWNYGGVWEQLSVPQGVAFVTSVAHARALDWNLSSSVAEVINVPMEFDFGVETEIDAWRWATAAEPSQHIGEEHNGVSCDRDGRCPRDPVRWTLEGSLDSSNWVSLQVQDSDYIVPVSRQRFLPFITVRHTQLLSILDLWPDGRSTCAARR